MSENDELCVLWVGDSPTANTGFGRVSDAVLSRLYRMGWNTWCLGVNFFGDPHGLQYIENKIYPAAVAGDVVGAYRIAEVTRQLQPDVVMLFGDLWHVTAWKSALRRDGIDIPTACYFPVDGQTYAPSLTYVLTEIDAVATYTQFGVNVVRQSAQVAPLANPQSPADIPAPGKKLANIPITVIPHGVDTTQFFPRDRTVCRAELKQLCGLNLRDDVFVFLNANRNQPRKRLDITIEAFCIFIAGQPEEERERYRLWLHCDPGDPDGWQLDVLYTQAMLLHGVDVSRHSEPLLLLSGPNLRGFGRMRGEGGVDVSLLNTIYNACDVGINSSMGEGWGLVTHEHAACQRAQIVPQHSACTEIWSGSALSTPANTPLVDRHTGVTHLVVDPRELAIQMEELIDATRRNETAHRCFLQATRPAYNWDSIAKHFDFLLRSAL